MDTLAYGYGGLAIVAFLAATVLPLSSELAVVALLQQGYPASGLLVVATLANLAGACTTYLLGTLVRQQLWQRFFSLSTTELSRAGHWFHLYGPAALLLSWLPVIGDLLVAAAGVFRVPWAIFLPWVLTGKLLRYAAVIGLTDLALKTTGA